MAGVSLDVAGRPVIYFAAGERLSADDEKAVGFDLSDDRCLRDHPRVRRVLTTLLRRSPKFYGALHWSDGSDLRELDRRVRNGMATDHDFSGALLSQLTSVVCLQCEGQFRALVVDGGQPLFAQTRAERLRKHIFQNQCPSCDSKLNMHIVEFL